tara:strand:- start:627 stop:815 length:189 start_codon:yes stop_codon:yes gene_type:complete
MIPVTSINSITIGNGKPGKYYKSLMQQWSTNMGVDIIQQIKNWDSDTKKSVNKNKLSPYRFK